MESLALIDEFNHSYLYNLNEEIVQETIDNSNRFTEWDIRVIIEKLENCAQTQVWAQQSILDMLKKALIHLQNVP